MTYELAKKLRDAGFPQEDREYYWSLQRKILSRHSDYFIGIYDCADPTLSELIEACGDSFGSLNRRKKQDGSPLFWAEMPSGVMFTGTEDHVPETAVANLWLSLPDKKLNY